MTAPCQRATAQPPAPPPLPQATAWIEGQGWQVLDFQRTVWQAMAEGRSGLLHASTGAGKTLAVWLGALQRLALPPGGTASQPPATPRRAPPLTVLWLTPMRALAADTLRALERPMQDLAPHWRSGLRTADTSSSERARQQRRLPTLLITTPESLSLLLAHADAREALQTIALVVVDEWHELLGNKRGVQVQLALARLAGWNPALMVWGLSATLANLPHALDCLLPRPLAGQTPPKGQAASAKAHPTPAPAPLLVRGLIPKTIQVDTLLPERLERFAWAGHMGLQMLPQVARLIEGQSGTTLIFTNTRAQAERWYHALLQAQPDLAGALALHHGSLDKSVREWVELGLKQGRLKAVIATSSLDLGVDFLPVERVLQIGSGKSIARLVQRAGRSGHAPGRSARITLVPTHSLELLEAAAARAAIAAGHMEARHSPQAPLDVLVQHLVTVALGGGFAPEALRAEVQRTAAYAQLSDAQWQWCLDFVRRGGPSLQAYPDFQRVTPDAQGLWRMPDARLARRHRHNIGTIVSDAAMTVQFVRGARLGSVEESFIARLKPGDVFLFAGRLLELVRVHEMTAQVRTAKTGAAALPRWSGGRMPLSGALAEAMLDKLAAFAAGHITDPEMQCIAPLLQLQQRWSGLPQPGLLLAETLHTREGWHLFLYPFAGRLVHMGLAALLAWRAAQNQAGTFSLACNDYGLELLSAKPIDWASQLPALLAPPAGAALATQVLGSINASELARRRFRDIARIAGLIFQSHPGERRSSRQLQASASLYYEVFRQHDPANRLLQQAQDELLQEELHLDRLAQALQSMHASRLCLHALAQPTPLAFPLMVERLRERLSNEPLADRIARMVARLEQAAGAPDAPGAPGAPTPASPSAQEVRSALLMGESQDAPGHAPPPRQRRSKARQAPEGNGSNPQD